MKNGIFKNNVNKCVQRYKYINMVQDKREKYNELK
jgi:hypothetical protein